MTSGQVRECPLVGCVCIGVEKAHGDRLDALRDEIIEHTPRFLRVERFNQPAIGVDALRHLESEVTRHQRNRVPRGDVVGVVPGFPPHRENVPKSFGGHEGGLGTRPFNECVDDQCRTVDDVLRGAEKIRPSLIDSGEAVVHGLRGIRRRGQDFGELQGTSFRVEHNEIRKRAANVTTQSKHRHLLLPRSQLGARWTRATRRSNVAVR